MANAQSTEKPCTVSTARGFSILYKDRLLYSKYDPQKLILQTINSLQILPGTLFLCCSPCLCYGLKELYQKLKPDCFIFACEIDSKLHELTTQHFNEFNNINNISLLSPNDFKNLPYYLENGVDSDKIKLPAKGTIRRVVRIDFSAGIQFNQPLYDTITMQCQNVISQFWKNRLTLVRFGRLYSRNLFQNIARSTKSTCVDFDSLKNKITKTILVCGAGESLETCIKILSDISVRQKLYLIAVDAALPSLNSANIMPDAVVGVESQLAIEKAYIGIGKQYFTFFADISSRPHITDIVNGNVCFFSSKYDSNPFIKKLERQNILPEPIPPLGSVGLTAVQIALLLRASENVPILVTGLDFSYSLGKTHANGAPAHTASLSTANRLHGIENYRAAFSEGCMLLDDKQNAGKKIVTTTALLGYAKNFAVSFSTYKNLYNIGSKNITLGIPFIDSNWFNLIPAVLENTNTITQNKTNKANKKQAIQNFLTQEKNALQELRELLVNGSSDKASLTEQILFLLKERDYLYLHFPDGIKASADLSFLKRVRSEIDFFLKDINLAITIISNDK